MSVSQLTQLTQTSDQYIALLEQLYHERNLTQFTAGHSIPLRRGEIYVICRGIVQLHTIHPDGSETL